MVEARHTFVVVASVDFEGKPNLFSDDRDNSGWARLPLNIDLDHPSRTHFDQNWLSQKLFPNSLISIWKSESTW